MRRSRDRRMAVRSSFEPDRETAAGYDSPLMIASA